MAAVLSLLLTIAFIVCGALTLIDKFILEPRRKAEATKYQNATQTITSDIPSTIRHTPRLFKIGRSYFPALAFVFIIRSFLVEPFVIPSGSMIPTLAIGDYILSNKFAYGIRLPVINKKIISIGDPQRGDVVVFRYPIDPSIDFIKRVIGLPGDKIRYTSDKHLYVNNQLITDEFVSIESDSSMGNIGVYNERIGNTEHLIHKSLHANAPGEWTVPDDHYFMMGDNRDNSNDSRYWNDPNIPKEMQGMVPNENIVGKAFLIWLNWQSPKLSNFPTISNNRFIK